jgi:DNA-binding NtrC family response regulator
MSGTTRPAFLVVDDDIHVAAALEEALNRRFGADYKIIAASSPKRGLSVLERLRARDEQVAVVIADQWMPLMTGVDFLLRAHQLHPAARRVVLLDAFVGRHANAVSAGGSWERWHGIRPCCSALSSSSTALPALASGVSSR